MAKTKCPMAGISECSGACMWYENGKCGVLVALSDIAGGLGAVKRELKELKEIKPKDKK